MTMLVEQTAGLGFRTIRMDGRLYPIGTPLPFTVDNVVYRGKVVGYGQIFPDSVPVQVYLIELDEELDVKHLHVSVLAVHPQNVWGSMTCDVDACGCGESRMIGELILHRWDDGELSWMCQDCCK